MPRTGARNVKISFTAGHLTHFGGVYLLHRFLQQLRVRTFLYPRLHIPEWNNYFSVTERLLAMMYPMILGLNTIELKALLGTNGVFQYLTGLPKFPHPDTLRQFLVKKAPVLQPRLHAVHNDLRAHFLILPHPLTSLWFDFDSTARTLYGHQEGVAKGYNPHKQGAGSYHPLLCAEARLGDCLGGKLRHGNASSAAGGLDMLDEVLAIVPAGVRETRGRVRLPAGRMAGGAPVRRHAGAFDRPAEQAAETPEARPLCLSRHRHESRSHPVRRVQLLWRKSRARADHPRTQGRFPLREGAHQTVPRQRHVRRGVAARLQSDDLVPAALPSQRLAIVHGGDAAAEAPPHPRRIHPHR